MTWRPKSPFALCAKTADTFAPPDYAKVFRRESPWPLALLHVALRSCKRLEKRCCHRSEYSYNTCLCRHARRTCCGDGCTDIEGMMKIVGGMNVAASRLAMGAVLGVLTSCRGDK